jgi:single-strand DNA-binding protein
VGLVTREDTPPVLYFHTFWLYLSGDHKCEFTVATHRKYKDSDGDLQEETEFHTAIAWRKDAEIICQFAKKGDMILVDGRLKTRSWDKDGVKHYRTEIMVDSFRLGPKAAKPAHEEVPVIAAEEAASAEVPF